MIYGQFEEPIEFEEKRIIKVSMYTLVHIFTPAFQFSYEKEYRKDRAWQLDVGYINDLNYGVWDERLNGFRARFELRKYRHNFKQLRYYHGFALQTKQTFAQNEQWVSRYNQSYSEILEYNRWTASVGGFFVHGFQSNFENNNMVIDFGMVYGLRLMHRQYFDFPNDAELIESPIGFRSGWHFFPTAFPVLKFGVAI